MFLLATDQRSCDADLRGPARFFSLGPWAASHHLHRDEVRKRGAAPHALSNAEETDVRVLVRFVGLGSGM